jgi:hypothetical protein
VGRRAEMFEDTFSYELYNQWVAYSKKVNTIPNPFAFCNNALPTLGYRMKWPTFQYHLMKMQLAGVVKRDKLTDAYILRDLNLF